MNSATIRIASAHDIDALFDIRTSVQENYQGLEELAGIGFTHDSVREMLDADARAWIAEVGGEAVAFSMAKRAQRVVFAVFVRPGHEGRGLGRALMQRAEAWLFGSGADEIQLTTGSDPSLRAHGFYRRIGWKEDGPGTDGQVRYVRRRPVVRGATLDDAAGVHAIYAPVVRDTVISFEYDVPDVHEMRSRIAKIRDAGYPWLVADDEGVVIGYAYAGPFRNRKAYDWTCEVSVYVHAAHRGRGVGVVLYERLFAVLKAQGFRAAVAGATWPNAASEALHLHFGFRQVALFPGIGWKFGAWHDVIF
jgi:L-amino acid N-acyltransferase YncA